jgi:hypothetical protein
MRLVRQSLIRASIVIASVIASLAIATSACAPDADLEGRSCPCADGYRCCDPAGVCIADDATCTGGTIASAVTVSRMCSEPHGPALPPPLTAASLVHFLARRWFNCAIDQKAPSTAIAAHDGIELSSGTWTFLRATADGYEPSTDPADQGTYQVWNDRLNQLVEPTDTTPGYNLHIVLVRGSIVLSLFFDFERVPLRFRSVNGGELWFAGEGHETGDGADLAGDEGTSCVADHASCKPGKKCVSVISAELCEQPAMNLPQGAGCDPMGVRACAPPLVCLGTKQCGTAP